MAKSKRKSGGCTRGRFKRKKLGKGWATQRRTPRPAAPAPAAPAEPAAAAG
jgi:hypothetical protein